MSTMPTSGLTNQMKNRTKIVVVALTLVGFVTLLVRLFTIQLVDNEWYQQQASKQQMKETQISAKRGSILERNGKTLAASATAWTIYLAPSEVVDKTRETIASGLSEILGISRDLIMEKSLRNTGYEILKRKVERPVAEEVIKFLNENEINSVGLEEDNKRYYPYDNFASDILGFTGSENKGSYGLESYYEKVLAGTPGKIVSAKNAWGEDMPFKYEEMYSAEDGNNITLTIDEVIQHVLEKNMETAVSAYDVRNRAAGIVMDVNTGEILGMASKNDFDPNTPLEIFDEDTAAYIASLTDETEHNEALKQAQYDQWRNKAISDPYEPGSVFKIITAAAALEEKVVSAGDTFDCPGYIHTEGGTTISCWKTAGHGHQTFVQGIMNSCNPVFITVGQRLGIEKFREYFEAFGLMETTGVDLPGEAVSVYHTDEVFGKAELASSSMGQTFKVTPLQLITAVSAAVNGGKLMQPYIVKSITDSEGNIIEETAPTVKRQVISEETSRELALMLEKVVAEGSGKTAQVPGYRIGGKTGTSEKLDQNIEEDGKRYISSFLGFAPVDDPQVAVLIMLDEPDIINPYGSVLAAPVVGAVLEEILPYLGIEPTYTEEQLAKKEVEVPYLVGWKAPEAQSEVRLDGLDGRIIGSGGVVVKQVPEAGAKVMKGDTVLLYTEESDTETAKVPNVVGRTLQEANEILTNAGFQVSYTPEDIEGKSAVVAAQSPSYDAEVPKKTVIELELSLTTPSA